MESNNCTTADVARHSSLPEDCVDEEAMRIPLAVLYSLIFVVGLVGNILALWVFFCVQSTKNSVHVFLLNVACADLLLIFCLPFRILYHSHANTWTLSPILCNLVGNLFYMNMYISITLLGLISVDRYLKMHNRAGRRRLLSTKRSVFLCAIIWTVAFLFFLPYMIFQSNTRPGRCFHYKNLSEEKWKAYINICGVLTFWSVFISLMVSYGKIALKLLRRSQENPDLPSSPSFFQNARKSFFILFVFTICFLPYHMVRPFYIATQIQPTSLFWRNVANTTNELTLVLSALNSCLDPVMYYLLSSSVRKEVLNLVSRVFCLPHAPEVSATSYTADMDGRKTTDTPNQLSSAKLQENNS
uniref:Probable G-protein coupled receptor 34 n=1 Tax=Oryzias latipes TaxID=8090 RepID=A0A3P9HNR0_ORYLA